ncbi:MAG: serine hydrolase domain-containing protein [Planctomycetota bacterium]
MHTFHISFLLLTSCLGLQQTATKPKTDTQPIVSRIDTFLNAAGVRGGILIAKDGEIMLSAGYGFADEERKSLITTKTVFDIGSISKQFTGAAILKLQEEGKLRVTDTLNIFFKDVPVGKQSITIHQLLTHTGGFGPDIVEFPANPSRDEAVRIALDSKLVLRPGEKYKYSNTGYVLLANIIEIASGTSYENFVNSKLWKPAGMQKTGYILPKYNDDEVSHGFDISGSLGLSSDTWAKDGPSWRTRGAGGVLSTLEDLYKWHLALNSEAVLSARSKAELFKAHVAETDDGASHYGYGWAIHKTPRQTRLIAHDGSNGIFFADFHRYVDENVVIIYFTNERNSTSRGILNSISSAFFDGSVPSLPSTSNSLSPSELVRYTGTYQLPLGETFELELQKNQLSLPALTWGMCKLLTNFPKVDDSERTRNLDVRTGSTMKSIVSGDFARIADVLDLDGSLEEEKSYWTKTRDTWVKRFGEFKRSEVIGSRVEKQYLNTYVLLQFERGATVVQFRQNDKQKFLIGTANNLLTSQFCLMPESKTGFFVYNHALRTTVPVTFDFDGANVTGFTIAAADGSVRAKKVLR